MSLGRQCFPFWKYDYCFVILSCPKLTKPKQKNFLIKNPSIWIDTSFMKKLQIKMKSFSVACFLSIKVILLRFW